MRLAWKLAQREARRRLGRTLLVVTLIGVAVGGITVGDLAMRSHRLAGPSHLGQAAAVITVQFAGWKDGVPRDRALTMLRDALPPATTAEFGWQVWVPVWRADDNWLGGEALLSTVDYRTPLLRGAVEVSSGRLPAGEGEALVSARLAAALDVEVGERVALARPPITLHIVGVGNLPGSEGELLVAPSYPIEALWPDVVSAVAYVDRFTTLPSGIQTRPDDGIFVGLDVAPSEKAVPLEQVLLLWLGCTLLLGVLGSVVAAAFAASGRRQLVTIGQLGAAGADQRLVRRFLALQGSVTSLAGALVGVVAGFAVAAAVGDPLLRSGRWGIAPLDLLSVIGTTVVVGTVAALLPTRSLASAPVLAALAGRAPVRVVRPRQVVFGGVAVGLGLFGLAVAAAGRRTGSSAADVAVAMISGATVMGGAFAVSPAVVDQWGRVARWTSGARRLALRSMVRHRARSASLVAAVAAVGAVGVAGASLIERYADTIERQQPRESQRFIYVGPRHAVVRPTEEPAPFVPLPLEPDAAVDERAGVERVVGDVSWTKVEVVKHRGSSGPFGEEFTVATNAALRAYGVPEVLWSELQSASDYVVLRSGGSVAPGIAGRVIPGLVIAMVQMTPPRLAQGTAWQRLDDAYVGEASADLTYLQRSRLANLSAVKQQDWVFVEQGDVGATFARYVGWGSGPSEWTVAPQLLRWGVLGGLLLLFGLIVSIGLALWAAEGKVERDQLVALGARPRTLAGVAAVRAWTIVVTGSVLAVALGWSVLWVVFEAADPDNRPPFPWVAAMTMVLVLPLLLGVASSASSAIAQRVRPVRALAMALD